MLFAKEVKEMYLENIARILLPHNMCGTTFFIHFPHYFNAYFMRKQHKPFYQCNCVKNHKPFYPTKFEMKAGSKPARSKWQIRHWNQGSDGKVAIVEREGYQYHQHWRVDIAIECSFWALPAITTVKFYAHAGALARASLTRPILP
jgi:hypothetical protein